MNNKSIDGLRRRSKKTIGRTNTESSPRNTKEPTPKFQNTLSPINPENEAAIRDFLSSVQDSDPTDLIGLPPEKEELPQNNKDRKKLVKRAKKGQKKKKHKVRRIILSISAFLLIIIIGLCTWAYIQGNDFISRVTGGGNLWDVITADPDTPLKTDPSSGRTNVLVFGTEGYSMDDPNYDGGWLTDSMMVASINQETGDVKTISLPRDMKTKTCTSTSKLNELYYCAYSKNSGTEESRQEHEKLAARSLAIEVEKILGIEIQYFVHVNWQALVDVVSALDGIYVVFTYGGQTWSDPNTVTIETTSKKGLADWSKACNCYVINYPNGQLIKLSGWNALAVARARNEAGGWGASDGNFSRELFQQKIIQATIMRAKDTNFVTDFMAALKIKDAVGDNIRMDFQDKELKTLFKLAGNIDIGNMEAISLLDNDDGGALLTTGMLPVPGVNNLECGGTRPGCLSYVYPKAGVDNYTAIHNYMDHKLSSNPSTSENAKITIMNATTTSGLAATEGKKLTEKGLYVESTTNAPTALKNTEGIVIYQKTKSMTNTAKTLSDFYNVEITTTIPDSLNNEPSDFIIIIGNGYAKTN
ncbi:MAG: LCP family protein [Candidatus Nomurabacteria bacterium]|jgi:anionic cell wall polymer biosynthesis LytR-Cps2A-Psr (LCP) family protein|nr:LCP family protein [Candidatus Nomurabacteria bacterium]